MVNLQKQAEELKRDPELVMIHLVLQLVDHQSVKGPLTADFTHDIRCINFAFANLTDSRKVNVELEEYLSDLNDLATG